MKKPKPMKRSLHKPTKGSTQDQQPDKEALEAMEEWERNLIPNLQKNIAKDEAELKQLSQ